MCRPVTLIIVVSFALLAAFGLGGGWYFSNPTLSEDAIKKAKNHINGVFVNSEPTTMMKPETGESFTAATRG